MKKLSPPIVLDEAFGEKLHRSYDERLAEMFATLTHRTFVNTLYVSFSMPKKEWDEYRKSLGGLGQLYGVDLGNYLGRQSILNQYCVPVVDDKKRAKNGIKSIQVTYYLERK